MNNLFKKADSQMSDAIFAAHLAQEKILDIMIQWYKDIGLNVDLLHLDEDGVENCVVSAFRYMRVEDSNIIQLCYDFFFLDKDKCKDFIFAPVDYTDLDIEEFNREDYWQKKNEFANRVVFLANSNYFHREELLQTIDKKIAEMEIYLKPNGERDQDLYSIKFDRLSKLRYYLLNPIKVPIYEWADNNDT